MINNCKHYFIAIFILISSITLVSAQEARIFVKIKLNDYRFNNSQVVADPVQIGFIQVGSGENVLTRMLLGKNGVTKKFATGWFDAIDWSQSVGSMQILKGETTNLIDITDELKIATKGSRSGNSKMLLFTFNSPNRPLLYNDEFLLDHSPEAGNLTKVDAQITFVNSITNAQKILNVNSGWDSSSIGIALKDLPYVNQIESAVTMDDYSQNILNSLYSKGLTQVFKTKRMTITGSSQLDYWFSYNSAVSSGRLIGVAGIMGISSMGGFSYLWRDTARAYGVPLSFLQPHFVPWDNWNSPWSSSFQNILNNKAKEYEDWFANHIFYDYPVKVTVCQSDEVNPISDDMLWFVEDARTNYRSFLTEKGVNVNDLGYTSLNSVLPGLKKNQDVSNWKSLNNTYWTTHFRQRESARAMKKMKNAVRSAFSGKAHQFTIDCFEDFYTQLDYFYLAREGAYDVTQHHLNGVSNWPPEAAYFNFRNTDLIRSSTLSATSNDPVNVGYQMMACRSSSSKGVELTAMSALISGAKHFHFYGFNPKVSGWEWFLDDVDRTTIMEAVAKGNKLASLVENHLFDGKTSNPCYAAILQTRGTDLFEGTLKKWGYGTAPERRMVHAALAFNQYPLDVLAEEDVAAKLSKYKVLYIVDPFVERTAQSQIEAWVRNGGILFTTTDAANFDQVGRPYHLVDRLAGGDGFGSRVVLDPASNNYVHKVDEMMGSENIRNVSTLGTISIDSSDILGMTYYTSNPVVSSFSFPARYRRERLNAVNQTILGRYEDQTVAISSWSAGSGKVIRVGTKLGASWLATAQPAINIYTVPEAQIAFDPQIEKIYLYPFKLAGLWKNLTTSDRQIQMGGFEKSVAKGAVVMMANYLPAAGSKNVVVTAYFGKSYTTCKTKDGVSLPITKLDTWGHRVFNVPIQDTQVLIFE